MRGQSTLTLVTLKQGRLTGRVRDGFGTRSKQTAASTNNPCQHTVDDETKAAGSRLASKDKQGISGIADCFLLA
jgi:hypothetical protein